MSKFTTRKAGTAGRATTIERRTQRAVKYAGAARMTTAGRAR